MDTKKLAEFAQGASGMYLKFDEQNTPIEGLYTGYSIEPDPFNPGTDRVVYELEIAQQKKFLASGSKRLANAVLKSKAAAGDFIRITRTGSGFDTDYKVETSETPW